MQGWMARFDVCGVASRCESWNGSSMLAPGRLGGIQGHCVEVAEVEGLEDLESVP